MRVNGGNVTTEIDASDIEHLLKSGTTQVTAHTADVTVTVKCRTGGRISVQMEDPSDD